MEEELIDTTTEEGKKKLEEMEREGAAEAAPGGASKEAYPDPE